MAVGSFMSDLTASSRVWEGLHLASLARPVWMLDLPGHGLSSPHTFRQTYDLCVRKNLDSHIEPLTEAIQRLQKSDPIDYFGISHGGLVALKMTERDPQDRVQTVFGVDIPAVKDRWSLGMQFGYLVADNFFGRREYSGRLENRQYFSEFQAFSQTYAARFVDARAKSFIRNNPLLCFANLFASADARPLPLEARPRIMASKTASVYVVTGEKSKVSDSGEIEAFIESLGAAARARSQQRVIQGADHNIGNAYLMPRLAGWARAAYEG